MPSTMRCTTTRDLTQAGEFEEGIKEKLRVNLEPVVGQQLALSCYVYRVFGHGVLRPAIW